MTKPVDARFLQPPLLWGYFLRWYDYLSQHEDLENHPYLLIYVNDGPGAYYFHGPKCYWKANSGDSFSRKTEADILEQNRDRLGEVEAFIFKSKGRNPKLWLTFEDFIAEITQEAVYETGPAEEQS